MHKKDIIEYILSVLRSNTNLLEKELKSISEEKNSITKSSSGDKHETSRAQMQSEFDKINNNYQSQLNQIKVINLKLGWDHLLKRIALFYSLVLDLVSIK